MFRTLRFRLAFWHTLIFTAMALVIFGIAYQTVANQLLASINDDLHDTALEFASLLRSGDVRELRAEVASESLSHDGDEFYARYLDTSGHTVMVKQPVSWTRPLPKPDLHGLAMQWFDVVVNNAGDTARVLASHSPDLGWIQVGLSLHEYQAQLQKIIRIFTWSLLVVVVAGILVGWWQVRHVLVGVDQVRRTAMEIGEGDLERRLVLDGHGQELVNLAGVFNTMLDRIKQLLGEMRDVSDHIAHDLRTPVARIRGIAEGSLMENRGGAAEKDEALAAIVEESDRLSAMINTMLEIAQTDSGVALMESSPVDVGCLLREAHDLFLPVAEDADIEMLLDVQDEPLQLMGDAARLQRLIANLLDNAIKFTPSGGRITCLAHKKDHDIELLISDTGMGVSAEALPHLFERFYRADNSRSTAGNGLGLSYARSIARAHGGDIHIDSQDGYGATITVTLPVT